MTQNLPSSSRRALIVEDELLIALELEEVMADLGHQTVEFDYRGTHVVRDERYFLMGLCGSRADRHKPEKQFRPKWLSWEQALDKLSYQAEREWVRRARDALDTIS